MKAAKKIDNFNISRKIQVEKISVNLETLRRRIFVYAVTLQTIRRP